MSVIGQATVIANAFIFDRLSGIRWLLCRPHRVLTLINSTFFADDIIERSGYSSTHAKFELHVASEQSRVV